MGLWRKLFKQLIKPYEHAERVIVTHIYPCYRYAQPKTALVCIRVADENKVAKTKTFLKIKRKHQDKTQEINSQPIQRTSTTECTGHDPLLAE